MKNENHINESPRKKPLSRKIFTFIALLALDAIAGHLYIIAKKALISNMPYNPKPVLITAGIFLAFATLCYFLSNKRIAKIVEWPVVIILGSFVLELVTIFTT